MTKDNQLLRNIKTFDDLVLYLEDELGWPLQEYGFDQLTFEYMPSELGLKEEDVASVKAIHQLRPLSSGQPWGIFFVEFEAKKLPVVVLRRILSHLAIKKRSSANKSSSPSWQENDLLFITAFGENNNDAREIAIAHFNQNHGSMPTLNVLGWDGGDTPLKLANIDNVLRTSLKWPEFPTDTASWRANWSQPFRHRVGHVIRTSSVLAEELARLARGIRDKAKLLLNAESETGEITKLYKAFQTSLIHDLTPDSFADTYAQTITYGLLTAAISHSDEDAPVHKGGLVAENVVDMVPVTNPFLKEMLQTFLTIGGHKGGINFDELGIQNVVELLKGDETDLPEILRDFGNKTNGEDPVIHFYEHFLNAYNKELKIQRGVFYTPKPVVNYIVRSVHELLQSQFKLADGLADTATWGDMLKNHPNMKLPPLTDLPEEKRTISPDDPFVVILDPATGTATFLVEVIDVIFDTLRKKWALEGMTESQKVDAWNKYVPKHLLPRVHAYELMMAPYAIAHMKIGLKLAETGYRFDTEERVRIYLTNALEPWQRQLKIPDLEALAHEAEAVNLVKQTTRFTVIIGNPPYSLYSANLGEDARNLIEPYRFVQGEKIRERGALQLEKNLQDDYVKFFAFSEKILKATGIGLLSFISNSGYLGNRSLRGMRDQLLLNFKQCFITDLHGSVSRAKKDEGKDENVFDIVQGVSICFLVNLFCNKEQNRIKYISLKGLREVKYKWLKEASLSTTNWVDVEPKPDEYFLLPFDSNLRKEFLNWPSIDEIMPVNSSGIVTARDAITIWLNKDELSKFLSRFSKIPSESAREEYQLGSDTKDWSVERAQKDVLSNDLETSITPILYRPFDSRFTFYTGQARGFLCNPRRPTLRHMMGMSNFGLLLNRQVNNDFKHVLVTRSIVDTCTLSSATRETAYIFPLFIIDDAEGPGLSLFKSEVKPNISSSFLRNVQKLLEIKEPALNAESANLPLQILSYIYCILHSSSYRKRYAEFLRIDFARIPLTKTPLLFNVLSDIGRELISFHLLESPELDKPTIQLTGIKSPEVEKPSWSDNTIWVDKLQSNGFRGVSEDVWNFQIGGYQVCHKWLKDRKSKNLDNDDVIHYQKIIISISKTINLMSKIDEVIDENGGWPGAFSEFNKSS